MILLLQASEDILRKVITLGQDDFIQSGRFNAFFNNGSYYTTLEVVDNAMTGQKVTYGTLAAAIKGLGIFMTEQDSYFQTNFGIYDGKWGQVGYGRIASGAPLVPHGTA